MSTTDEFLANLTNEERTAQMSVLSFAISDLRSLGLDPEAHKAVGTYLSDWILRVHAAYEPKAASIS